MRDAGKCPGCDLEGEVGQACHERACIKRAHHYIPKTFWERAHHPTSAEVDPVIGQVIGDFLVVSHIGSGGFGRVFLGLQAPLYGLRGALKLMELERFDDDIAQALLSKFEGEAQALAALSHPNIVKLLKYGVHNQRPYLVMEYVQEALTLTQVGQALRASDDLMDIATVRSIVSQVTHALDAAHRKQIIHRDIKPDNLMIQEVPGHAELVRVLDFGLAKFTAHTDTTQLALGTPQYMAPEQLQMRDIGPWTDLYALGVVSFWLLTGQKPFDAQTHEDILALKLDPDFDPISTLRSLAFPQPVISWLSRAMAYDHEQRHQNAQEFLEDFELAMNALLARGSQSIVSDVTLDAQHKASSGQASTTPSSTHTRSVWAKRAALGMFGLAGLALGVTQIPAQSPTPNPTPIVDPAPQPPILVPEQSSDMTALIPTPPDAPSPQALDAFASATQQLDDARARALNAHTQEAAWRTMPALTRLSLGKFHSCALTKQGRLWCWGGNEHGELGIGHTRPQAGSPERMQWKPVGLSNTFVDMAAAGDRKSAHTCAIEDTGALYCWGDNQFGQLGLGHTISRGDDEALSESERVPLLRKALQVDVGASSFGSHTCARLQGAALRCWGHNRYGQLGLGHTDIIGDDEPITGSDLIPLRGVEQMATGKYHTCARLKNTQVHCWGWNERGQLGLGHTKNIGDDEPVGLHSRVRLPSKLVPIVDIDAGRMHTCVVARDQKVYCWGWNNKGQLGRGDEVDQGAQALTLEHVRLPTPVQSVQAGDLHTCALGKDRALYCWGDNKFGQLGLGHQRILGDNESVSKKNKVPLPAPVDAFGVGSYHTCARVEGGKVYCWGLNSKGQLGTSNLLTIGGQKTSDEDQFVVWTSSP